MTSLAKLEKGISDLATQKPDIAEVWDFAFVCERKVSSSVLLYEIICAFLGYLGLNPNRGKKDYIGYGQDLYWVPDINLAT